MSLPLSLAWSLAALALGMGAVFVFALWCPDGSARERRRWALAGLGIVAINLGLSGALAASGALANLDARPAPVAILLVTCTLGMAWMAYSRVGDRLLAWPLWALVGAQSFRILVELWLSAAHGAGVVPAEVTYHGWNVDVLTGLTALGLGVWLWQGSPPRWVVAVWNVAGLALLVVVAATAALSAFGVIDTDPRMTLPATFPGVWLPAWLVQLAFLGHLLVFRALIHDRRPSSHRREAA